MQLHLESSINPTPEKNSMSQFKSWSGYIENKPIRLYKWFIKFYFSKLHSNYFYLINSMIWFEFLLNSDMLFFSGVGLILDSRWSCTVNYCSGERRLFKEVFLDRDSQLFVMNHDHKNILNLVDNRPSRNFSSKKFCSTSLRRNFEEKIFLFTDFEKKLVN